MIGLDIAIQGKRWYKKKTRKAIYARKMAKLELNQTGKYEPDWARDPRLLPKKPPGHR